MVCCSNIWSARGCCRQQAVRWPHYKNRCNVVINLGMSLHDLTYVKFVPAWVLCGRWPSRHNTKARYTGRCRCVKREGTGRGAFSPTHLLTLKTEGREAGQKPGGQRGLGNERITRHAPHMPHMAHMGHTPPNHNISPPRCCQGEKSPERTSHKGLLAATLATWQ